MTGTARPWRVVTGLIVDNRGNIIAARKANTQLSADDADPLRYRQWGEGTISPTEADENARFIVRAANSYDMLIATLKSAKNDLILAGYEPYSREVAHIRAVIDEATKEVQA